MNSKLDINVFHKRHKHGYIILIGLIRTKFPLILKDYIGWKV